MFSHSICHEKSTDFSVNECLGRLMRDLAGPDNQGRSASERTKLPYRQFNGCEARGDRAVVNARSAICLFAYLERTLKKLI
jgi:hypothetical protein